MTNDEYLKELASRGDGSLQAWFDAEHVDNTRSVKRAAAVERLRDYENWSDHVKKSTLAKAVIGADSWGPTWQENRDALIDLLTDDDGLQNNDGVAAEHVDSQFHGATRITNLERLFVDSEQFRQAVSAFAFAHSDDCPTSPTQMVDWLMAPYVDAQSKAQSKDALALSDLYGILSDANDDLAPESDVIAADVDANDENATCNNSDENVIHDSREKLTQREIDEVINNRMKLNAFRAQFGAGPTSMTDEQIKSMSEHYRPKEDVHMVIIDDAVIAAKQQDGQSNELKLAKPGETNATKDDIRDFDDSREKLEADVRQYANPSGGTGTLGACWEKKMLEFLDRQAEITHAETIHTYNLAAREARKVQKERIADLEEELAKRDKGIARLKRQRDEARQQISKLEAECDDCVYKLEWQTMDRLEAERDALAADLRDCEQQRERLRQALGCAIDHAHEILGLVNLDAEVI